MANVPEVKFNVARLLNNPALCTKFNEILADENGLFAYSKHYNGMVVDCPVKSDDSGELGIWDASIERIDMDGMFIEVSGHSGSSGSGFQITARFGTEGYQTYLAHLELTPGHNESRFSKEELTAKLQEVTLTVTLDPKAMSTYDEVAQIFGEVI